MTLNSSANHEYIVYRLGGAVKNVHIEGSKDGCYFARSVLKVRIISSNETDA